MNNKMITIPYADAIEYGENTSALFKALWELTDLIRLESDLKKHHRAYLHVREDIDEKVKEGRSLRRLPSKAGGDLSSRRLSRRRRCA